MGRPKGSKNKDTVPHKQVLEVSHEKTNNDLQKETNKMLLREPIQKQESEKMPDLPSSIYEDLASIASANQKATSKDELQILYARLCKEGKDQETALRELRGYVQSGASLGLQATVANKMALPLMSSETSQSDPQLKTISREFQELNYEREGRWFTKLDHHPLCLECQHREDRHHDWDVTQHQAIRKNAMTGKEMEVEWTTKVKNYHRSQPCQHACKCYQYK